MMPTRTYLRIAGAAVQRFLRTVGKVIGTEVLDDIVAFFRAFEGMEQGFRDRASRVDALLAEPETAFVLITSPRRDAVDEAEFFSARLRDADRPVDALIVNRVDPDFGSPATGSALRDRADTLDQADSDAARRLAARYRNLADYVDLGTRERHDLADVGQRIGAGTIAYVPSLPHDVVDFSALDAVARHLFGDRGGGAD
jgi:anion-transporting  ArsA/GET3 family ATPase